LIICQPQVLTEALLADPLHNTLGHHQVITLDALAQLSRAFAEDVF